MASWDPRAKDVIRCDLCVKAVELYCNPCQVNLCSGCVSKHVISKRSKKHEIFQFKERKCDTSQHDCSFHTEQKCDFFCKDCDEYVCKKCVAGAHRKHRFVHLDEYIIDQNKQSIMKENEELEKSIIPTYERNESEITEDLTSLLEKYEAIDSQISEKGEKWHKEIDIVIKRHKSEVNEMKTKDIQTMQGEQTILRDMLQIARDTLQTNKHLLQTSDLNEIKNYRSRIEELRTIPSRLTMTLPSFTALQIQGEHLYRQFGKLRAAIESEISAFEVKKFQEPHVANTIDSTKNPLWGLGYVLGGKFWIYGNGATIDLLDTQGTVLDTIETLSGNTPSGMTVTKDGNLVYCEGSKNRVNMVKNGNTKTIISSMEWGPNGVCSASSGGLIVYFINKGMTRKRIVKYDAEYKEVISIENDENGEPFLSRDSRFKAYLAENKNVDICIADTSGSIVVLDQNGKYRWRYNGNLGCERYNKFTPRGITNDSQGHIVAADRENHCLHVIDQDGQFVSYIDNCGIYYPSLLSVDEEDNLYVGGNRSPKTHIKVISYLNKEK